MSLRVHEKQEEYDRGVRDFKAKVEAHENPYHHIKENKRFLAWEDGWWDAFEAVRPYDE